MTSQAEFDALLDSYSEPALILSQDGIIERFNRRALTHVPGVADGVSILQIADDPAQLRQFLSRCLGTNEKCVGATRVLVNGRTMRFRLQGHRFPSGKGGRPRIFLRCFDSSDERFSLLSHRIDELNAENRKRRHLQAMLEESLRERELLIREIHHRVKNNIQMLAALLNLNERDAQSEEAKAALNDAARRVRAMGAFQQVLYQSKNFERTSAKDLMGTLVEHVRDTIPGTARIECQVDEIPISADQSLPFSLIVNELVTNAAKHGLKQVPAGTITITLRREGADVELCVHNPGAGFEFTGGSRRASGLGLVKGLARQLGGNFSVGVEQGVTCTLRFKNEPRSLQ
jgi:two-component sensor histidine kinase